MVLPCQRRRPHHQAKGNYPKEIILLSIPLWYCSHNIARIAKTITVFWPYRSWQARRHEFKGHDISTLAILYFLRQLDTKIIQIQRIYGAPTPNCGSSK
jgi:hypothetical protein